MKTISAEEFDRLFDAGDDISDYVDWRSVRRPGREPQQVLVTLPGYLVAFIEAEARRNGQTCDATLVAWLQERHHASTGL